VSYRSLEWRGRWCIQTQVFILNHQVGVSCLHCRGFFKSIKQTNYFRLKLKLGFDILILYFMEWVLAFTKSLAMLFKLFSVDILGCKPVCNLFMRSFEVSLLNLLRVLFWRLSWRLGGAKSSESLPDIREPGISLGWAKDLGWLKVMGNRTMVDEQWLNACVSRLIKVFLTS